MPCILIRKAEKNTVKWWEDNVGYNALVMLPDGSLYFTDDYENEEGRPVAYLYPVKMEERYKSLPWIVVTAPLSSLRIVDRDAMMLAARCEMSRSDLDKLWREVRDARDQLAKELRAERKSKRTPAHNPA